MKFSTLGPYRLVRLVGSGGMGEVYEARKNGEAPVALKVFSVDPAKARFLRERFVAEGRRRASMLAKGMIYSPQYGEVAFTVPMFDAFLRRIKNGRN